MVQHWGVLRRQMKRQNLCGDLWCTPALREVSCRGIVCFTLLLVFAFGTVVFAAPFSNSLCVNYDVRQRSRTPPQETELDEFRIRRLSCRLASMKS